ncbi:uncharacterized protein LOC122528123 isoform X2 [Frieseomelitta varia]|uniref:uncharacterized protein LOC122528123 isoform X2 n=1 Tax=Frieseomelitta varia TaxID=561572 RepID=UPI001CB6AE5B|nr:uncharacterized protein LOC122528123 isoform X2 [Frieseomelitta varia]
MICTKNTYVNDSRVETIIAKINNVRDTMKSLEESLATTRKLETEQWLRYSNLKTKNKMMMDDLRKANKRNKNMLNLFRQSVTDIRFGSDITLPESLKKEVQRSWHQKYDALLTCNEQLKQELSSRDLLLKEKTQEINSLQQKLLTLGDRLVERDEAVESICKKYLSLKQRKDERENLLRGSIETLKQDTLKKTNVYEASKKDSGTSSTSNKDALLTRETRRSDRSACKNCFFKILLEKAKRSCKTNGSSSVISLDKTA